MDSLQVFDKEKLSAYLKIRKGEQRLGEHIRLYSEVDKTSKFCIIGVPECIGPLGNGGKAGAQFGFEAFLKYFLNMQSNRFLSGKELVLAGQVVVDDLMESALGLSPSDEYYRQQLHVMCERLDERVQSVVEQVKAKGLVPIVIGGGHNNAYPIISALGRDEPINVLNFDAHADFRALEGRHSGNGFSYAYEKGYLDKYAVYGLHQSYNSENMLKHMEATPRVSYSFFEDEYAGGQLLQSLLDFVGEKNRRIGLEVDMDAISMMPSSALSPSGFSLDQMRLHLKKVVSALSPCYLHLTEAAPITSEEELVVGKALSYLVSDFVKTHKIHTIV